MKLITEEVSKVKFVTEGKGANKKMFIEGVFLQGDIQNRNGRMYPKEVLAKEAARYNKEYIQKNKAYGELGHPQGPTINLERVSHMIKELKPDGPNFMGRAKVLDTPYGNIVKNLIDEGAQLGVSSRGMGTIRERNGAQEVQSMSDVTPLPTQLNVDTSPEFASLMEMPSVQARGGHYSASEFKDAGVPLSTPSGVPETIIQQGQPQVSSMYRDPHTGKIPYALYQPQPVNTYGQGYDLGGMDYFTANQLALNEGADRFMYGGKYAAVDPGLLSNYRDIQDAGFSEDTAYGKIKPWGEAIQRDKIREATIGMPTFGGKGSTIVPRAEDVRKIAEGYERDHSGRLTRFSGTTRAERYRQLVDQGIDMTNPLTRSMHGFKHGGQIADTAEGLASFGRYGDNILVHMNPEELSGLASLGQITYNPVTGLPEAFSLKGLFKGIRKLAPVVLAVAAPHIFGVAGATGLAGAVKIGAATAFGSGLGHLIAGAKPKDALKAGLMSGLLAGGGSYLSGMGSAAASGAGTGGTSLVGTAGKVGPGSMGAGGFGQAIGAGKSIIPTVSEFANVGKIPSYGQISKPPIQLAQQSVDPNIGNPMIARDITPVQNFAPQQITYAPDDYMNTNIPKETQVQGPPEAPKSTSIFAEGGLSKENLSRMGSEIYDKYSTPKGIAKLVGMDLMTPDYDIMYANEARAKEQALRDAGYTVETDFDKQTVIRDSQGVIMPRNLTPSMILDRALGRSPRQRMIARYGYGQAKHGGLVSLAHGGEFSGMVPGDGHGMEDNVYMPIKEGSEQVGTLAVSPSEYVVDSYTMAALGNGNADEGAKVMDGVVESVRKKAYGTIRQPKEIDGLMALKPMMAGV